MPRYQVTLPNGRTMVLEGDHPPTLEEAQAQFDAVTKQPTAPQAEPGWFEKLSNKIGPFSPDVKVSDLPPQSAELRGIQKQFSPEAAKNVREMQATGENIGAGLGLAALTGGTSALGNAVIRGAVVPGMLYQGGQALGVPPSILNTALVASGLVAGPSIRRAWQGAPMPETPAPMGLPKGTETNAQLDALARVRANAPPARIVAPQPREALVNEMLDALQKPEPPQGVELPPPADLPPGYEPRSTTPRIVSATANIKPPPLKPPSSDYFGRSAPTPEPPAPQQTSSIQPTPNAFVNVDKPQPLPTDEARTFSTGVTDPGERARMSETHTVLNQENNAYRSMKNAAGPDAGAVLREALLKKGTTAADLTPTVGPALLQALLDSLKTGGR